MKKVLTLLFCLAASIAVVIFIPMVFRQTDSTINVSYTDQSILEQGVSRIESEPHEITKIYNDGQLIGVLSDTAGLNAFLRKVYREDYQEKYPDSSASLGADVYVVREQSYYSYEDIDTKIFDYLRENELFALKATGVEFSDENGIYAEIYVANEEIYEAALTQYLTYFIDAETLSALNSGQQIKALTTYGRRATGISISQTITLKEVYAPAEKIMTTQEEILEYLEYGDNKEREYYEVKELDTVAGVGSINHGLSATQVMNINRDKISSVDQILTPGEKLCVTYFDSPIDVIVSMESMRKEAIYYKTLYVEDDSIREGTTEQKQSGIDGSKNSLYSEKWINGVLVSGSLVTSVDTLQPVDQIIGIGTMVIPGVGTGDFRWPVDNPDITCHWGCYYGHRAIDIQNMYNHYGPIYAADNGVVVENSYNWINGNYVVLNHNNGYYTYYGHMSYRSPLEVGTIVAKGDVIGTLGMTGYASGPHTHFFIFEYDEDSGAQVRYDPCKGFLDCEGL